MLRLCALPNGQWMDVAVIFELIGQVVGMFPGLSMRNGIGSEPDIATAYVRHCDDSYRHVTIE